MRRKVLIAGQLACLFIVIAALTLYHDALAQSIAAYTQTSRPATSTAQQSSETPALQDGAQKLNNTGAYVTAIMNPSDTTFQRLECPAPDLSRYQSLKSTPADSGIKYFFALDLNRCVGLLPRLLGSVVEAMRFLGPQHCALSIVEGNSDDGTSEVLAAIRGEIEATQATYFFQSSIIDPKQGDRVTKLAELRNLALRPMLDQTTRHSYSPNTTVVFLNDVAICLEDILELVFQRKQLGADMTCGFDWTYVGRDPTFYDVWIARTMAGDSFFEIPPGGSWDSAWNLFWNDPGARQSYLDHRPFQVFSCWNGAAVFGAAPVLDGAVAFRGTREGECAQGEPSLFCKDLWYHGYGKIAVVPSVNLEYTDERGRDIKALKGYTSRWIRPEPDAIEWKANPPDQVKCIPDYDNQQWRPWNETLP